jgi:long-subunit acyl-CoA synthetase (AMP-forming)
MWTFKDFYNDSIRMAKVFQSIGIRQNDVISIISENRFEFLSLALGAFYLNAKVAAVNTAYTERKFFQYLLIFLQYSIFGMNDKATECSSKFFFITLKVNSRTL